ncbi:hypothetical protein FOMPIDRAFT_1164011 [Fomitopsis schrenkii]|uniref:Uncharacterized protein n=1 Tax=Fomitopsis schrenkii TaxID=2126942 RepID=S8E3H2_FOMSC|nr:hypothetical protein FOMPIDRAFT_1164011 [Fomitopsis schrenkii]
MYSDSPVSAVPLELIQEIFLRHRNLFHEPLHAVPAVSKDSRSINFVPGYGWIAVSHVCRRWRAAAICCPPLWTQLSVTRSAEWTSEVLARSCGMPLRVTASLGLNSGEKVDALRTVLTDLVRIQSLQLSGHVDAEVVALLSNPAPSLEHLILDHITLPTPADPNLKHSDDALINFPYFLHHDLTPRLTHLELDAFQPRLRGPCTSALKHVVFRHRAAGTLLGRPYTSPCLHRVLAALQHMPALESLAFEREAHAVLDLAAEAELAGDLPDVVLPRLRALRIHATAEECVAFLDCATLPALEKFTLTCARSSTEYPPTLAPALARTAQALPATHALSISRFTGSGFHRYMRFTGRAPASASAVPFGGPTFDVMLDRGYGRENVIPLLAGCLPLQSVRELQVESRAEPEEAAWRTVLGAMPNLESVAVVGQLARQRLPELHACVEAVLGAEEARKEASARRRIPEVSCCSSKSGYA